MNYLGIQRLALAHHRFQGCLERLGCRLELLPLGAAFALRLGAVVRLVVIRASVGDPVAPLAFSGGEDFWVKFPHTFYHPFYLLAAGLNILDLVV